MQNGGHQFFQRALRREVSPPTPQVDAGKNQLGTTADGKGLYMAQASFERQGTAMTACRRNDAEGAAVATTILHLKIGASLAARPPTASSHGQLRVGKGLIHVQCGGRTQGSQGDEGRICCLLGD